jgi:hypothetical protein
MGPPGAIGHLTDENFLPDDDDVFLEAFKAELPALNLQMDQGNFVTHAPPVLVQGAPQEKGFMKVVADWSLDSDSDGTPDFVEFRNLANGFPLAEIYSADSNNNGVIDSLETDSDNDGIVDKLDLDIVDPALDWERTRAPKYAAFAFSIPNVSNWPDADKPLQINDHGEVLFLRSVWQSGETYSLAYEGIGIENCVARGMNNLGTVIGFGLRNGQPMPKNPVFSVGPPGGGIIGNAQVVCRWDDRDSLPVAIVDQYGYGAVAFGDAGGWGEDISPDSLIDDAGRFIAVRAGDPAVLCSWTFDPLTGKYSSQVIGEDRDQLNSVLAPSIAWGPGFLNGGILEDGGSLANLDFSPYKITRKTNGRLAAFSKTGSLMYSQVSAGSWKLAKVKGMDLSDVGIFVTDSVQFNFRGRSGKIPVVAPKVGEVIATAPGLFDISPSGFALGLRPEKVNNAYQTYAFLPISVDEVTPHEGVDWHTAQTPFGPTKGIVDEPLDGEGRFWIMVPKNGPAPGKTKAVIKSWASTENPVKLVAPGIVITPSVVTSSNEIVEFERTSSDVGDVDINIQVGDVGEWVSANSTPLGIKVMEKRVISITVWSITAKGPATPQNATGLTKVDPLFTKEGVESFLNRVFGKQTNAYFEVTWNDRSPATQAPLYPSWDQKLDGATSFLGTPDVFDITYDPDKETNPGPEASAVKAAHFDANAAINIYLIATTDHKGIQAHGLDGQKRTSFGVANGFAYPDLRIAFIDASLGSDLFSSAEKAERLPDRLRTIAHEIGHIMIGAGHPGQAGNSSPSPLPLTNHIERLMSGGDLARFSLPGEQGLLLVKEEWDLIEDWLNTRISLEEGVR